MTGWYLRFIIIAKYLRSAKKKQNKPTDISTNVARKHLIICMPRLFLQIRLARTDVEGHSGRSQFGVLYTLR